MNKLVSIIIPFYNVENYIEECLNSAINQTYKNLEIICVDDCSPDKSINIVNNFIKKDKRIKLIKHEKNLGLGGARNTGLKNATGDFVYFLDSDDYIDINYIETMVNFSKDAEVVVNNKATKIYEDGKTELIKNKDKFIKYSVLKFEQNMLDDMLTSTWSKLYNKDFLIKNNLFFPNYLKFEDVYFLNILKTRLEKIVFVYDSNYYYRQRSNSIISQSKIKNNQKDSIYIIENIYNFYKENNLLNDYNIPFKWLYKFFKRQKNKQEFFIEIKKVFKNMNIDINKYDNKNKLFFNSIINSNHYFIFKIKYIVGRLFI